MGEGILLGNCQHRSIIINYLLLPTTDNTLMVREKEKLRIYNIIRKSGKKTKEEIISRIKQSGKGAVRDK